MADRGRDLKIGILSDTSKFDLDAPARDLDTLGDKAKSAGQDIKGLDSDSDVAVRGIDALGDKSATTARKVDSAFEKIAASSKSNLRKVDNDTDKAKKGLDEFNDEANSTAREAGASFTGSFEDVQDTIQEVAANAFAGFGPAGAAAGLVAAAGIGIVATKIQEAREKVKELGQQLIESGNRLGTDDVFSRIGEAAVEGKLKGLIANAKALGITVSDLAVAFSANSSDIDKYAKELDGLRKSSEAASDGTYNLLEDLDDGISNFKDLTAEVQSNDAAVVRLQGSLKGYADQARKAEQIQQDFKDVTGLTLDALEGYEQALRNVSDPADDMATAIEDAAKRTAEATKSTEDSWQDYRDTAVASIDDVIAAQERDIAASVDFQKNAEKVFAAVGQAGLDWALEQGENADKAMEMLANAPKSKQTEVVSNYTELGRQSGVGLARGLTNQKPVVVKSAGQLHAAVQEAMSDPINVKARMDNSTLTRDARIAMLNLQAYYNRHPVTIPVKQGQRPIRDVP